MNAFYSNSFSYQFDNKKINCFCFRKKLLIIQHDDKHLHIQLTQN